MKNKKRLTFEKEAHFIVLAGRRMGLLIQGNKFKFYELAKKFLAKYLGGRCEV